MATAPRPRPQAPERVALRISLNGDERILHFADLGPDDDLACRKQTGLPVSSFIGEDAFGADSLLILWWMACRKSGDKRLTYRKVVEQFPTFAAVNDADWDVEAIEEDGVEVADDPLPSDGP